jgi:hypothetical protein
MQVALGLLGEERGLGVGVVEAPHHRCAAPTHAARIPADDVEAAQYLGPGTQ